MIIDNSIIDSDHHHHHHHHDRNKNNKSITGLAYNRKNQPDDDAVIPIDVDVGDAYQHLHEKNDEFGDETKLFEIVDETLGRSSTPTRSNNTIATIAKESNELNDNGIDVHHQNNHHQQQHQEHQKHHNNSNNNNINSKNNNSRKQQKNPRQSSASASASNRSQTPKAQNFDFFAKQSVV